MVDANISAVSWYDEALETGIWLNREYEPEPDQQLAATRLVVDVLRERGVMAVIDEGNPAQSVSGYEMLVPGLRIFVSRNQLGRPALVLLLSAAAELLLGGAATHALIPAAVGVLADKVLLLSDPQVRVVQLVQTLTSEGGSAAVPTQALKGAWPGPEELDPLLRDLQQRGVLTEDDAKWSVVT